MQETISLTNLCDISQLFRFPPAALGSGDLPACSCRCAAGQSAGAKTPYGTDADGDTDEYACKSATCGGFATPGFRRADRASDTPSSRAVRPRFGSLAP